MRRSIKLLELGGTAFITPYRFIYRVFYLRIIIIININYGGVMNGE